MKARKFSRPEAPEPAPQTIFASGFRTLYGVGGPRAVHRKKGPLKISAGAEPIGTELAGAWFMIFRFLGLQVWRFQVQGSSASRVSEDSLANLEFRKPGTEGLAGSSFSRERHSPS